jgi:hypothetical protein
MKNKDGQLIGNKIQYLQEEEVKKAIKPLKKFVKYNVEYLITYHGYMFNNNPTQKINELISGDLNN